MLLERDEIEVEIFDSILLEEVLSQEAGKIYTCLGERGSRMVLVQRGIIMDGSEIASVVGHVERLLPLITSR